MHRKETEKEKGRTERCKYGKQKKQTERERERDSCGFPDGVDLL